MTANGELNADTARELAAAVAKAIEERLLALNAHRFEAIRVMDLQEIIQLETMQKQQKLIDYALAEIGKLRAGQAVGDE